MYQGNRLAQSSMFCPVAGSDCSIPVLTGKGTRSADSYRETILDYSGKAMEFAMSPCDRGPPGVSRLAPARLLRIASSHSRPCFSEISHFAFLARQLLRLLDRWELNSLRM
jgi:hypothetical protein